MARNSRVSTGTGLGLLEVTDAGLPRRVNRPGPTARRGRRPILPAPEAPTAPAEPEVLDAETSGDPLYPVALLKIAMAMRRLPPEQELHFDSLLEDVLADLTLDREAFRGYLDKNMGRLMAAVRARGY